MAGAVLNVVKIDICRSKAFAARNEPLNPLIRTEALKKLLKVSQPAFPGSEDQFPTGSFYKADGDAVFYLIDKSSVALRGAIEFMQSWYQQGVPEYPECRVFIDRGFIDTTDVAGRTELTGRVFENIAIFEKGNEEGRIYLTEEVVDKCDQTMAKFAVHGTYPRPPNGRIKVYYVDYLDPRTVADSSLIHALFVANPKSIEARSRLYELFLVEYLLEKKELCDLPEFVSWARGKNYPLPPSRELHELLSTSSLILTDPTADPPKYRIKPDVAEDIDKAKRDFRQAQDECVNQVAECVTQKISTSALEGGGSAQPN